MEVNCQFHDSLPRRLTPGKYPPGNHVLSKHCGEEKYSLPLTEIELQGTIT